MPTGANRPLAGITVLDFGQVYQGPYATLLIRARSATVIRRRCQQLIEAKTKGLTIKPAGRVNAIAGHRFNGRPERSLAQEPSAPEQKAAKCRAEYQRLLDGLDRALIIEPVR